MSRSLRVGIIGAGFIGAVHARSARVAGARLVGVAGSESQDANELAVHLGAERGFDNAEALIGSPDVDVVHICTPNHLHTSFALAALSAGKHVVCEKPVALTSADAASMIEAAKQSQLVGAVPFAYRYYSTAREARARLQAAGPESVSLIHGSYLQDWLLTADEDNWRVDSRLGGASRAFADIGSHWCDLAEHLTGHRIVRLNASSLIAVPHRGAAAPAGKPPVSASATEVDTEDAVVAMFETDLGAVGSVVVSQISAGRKNRLWIEVDCASEAVMFNQEQPEELWLGRRSGVSVHTRDPARFDSGLGVPDLPPGHPQGFRDAFDAFVADVYRWIRTGEQLDRTPSFQDGLRGVRLTEAVLQSARSKRWQEIEEDSPWTFGPGPTEARAVTDDDHTRNAADDSSPESSHAALFAAADREQE